MYVPGKSKCLLVPSGPATDGKHLYIIMTRECDEGCHLVIPVESVYPGEYYDPACLFKGGEHTFIKHLTFVSYSRARIWSIKDICRHVANFTYLLHDDATPELIAAIYEGANHSKRASKLIKSYLTANS